MSKATLAITATAVCLSTAVAASDTTTAVGGVTTIADSIAKNGADAIILAAQIVVFLLFALFFVTSQKNQQREQAELIRGMQGAMQDNLRAFHAEIAEERRVYRDSMAALVGSINELQVEVAKLSTRADKRGSNESNVTTYRDSRASRAG